MTQKKREKTKEALAAWPYLLLLCHLRSSQPPNPPLHLQPQNYSLLILHSPPSAFQPNPRPPTPFTFTDSRALQPLTNGEPKFHSFLLFRAKAKMLKLSRRSFLMPLHRLIEALMPLQRTSKQLIRLVCRFCIPLFTF